VNVHGVIKVSQAFLPLMHRRDGRDGQPGIIMHIGSVSGTFATPFLGPYCASKYALEAISDCMRRELAPMGIRVVLLQPASVHSAIWDKAMQARTYAEGTTYEGLHDHKERIIRRAARSAMDTSRVTRVVWRVATGRARRPRYLITRSNLLYKIFRMLPDGWLDIIFSRQISQLQAPPG
ncbi:MAG: SDR family NAD(P)-dependent oxidoreductase, partial [Saprospiraceae bacterium]|nr:SDR family NAD(P)-dependent oxidoreductase [Saprospiraceae bacterium]